MNKKINVIAHRGANEFAPQNTLPAFEKAVEIGCDGFETDIHLTKDGVPVVCHNFTVDETSNGKGEISEMTLSELRELDFGSYKSKEYAGTKIPTLDEFLDVYAKKKMSVLNIELKCRAFSDSSREMAQKVIASVKEHGLFDDLIISSFNPQLLVACKEIDKACKTGLLYSPDTATGRKICLRPIKFAQEIGCNALHPLYLLVNKRYVTRAHNAGIAVNAWTVDSEVVAKAMIYAGVDGIITNLPDKINSVLMQK